MNTAIAMVETNLVRLRRASEAQAHLAPADDLFLHEVLGDVEHRDGDHHVADRFQQRRTGLAPRPAQRVHDEGGAVDAERQRDQHQHRGGDAEHAARDEVDDAAQGGDFGIALLRRLHGVTTEPVHESSLRRNSGSHAQRWARPVFAAWP